MAIYPHAHQRILGTYQTRIDGKLVDVPLNHYVGGNHPRLVIVHIMEGSLDGTDAWFHNPESQVSAHLGVGRDGKLIQWVDTDDRAWHAVNANGYSIGIELEGKSGEPATDPQIQQVAHIFHWAHHKYEEIELWLNRRPYIGNGLSWHGLGGFLWGNHPHCPGAPIVYQLEEIVDEARAIEHAHTGSAVILTNAQAIDGLNPGQGPGNAEPLTPEELVDEAPKEISEVIPTTSSTDSSEEMKTNSSTNSPEDTNSENTTSEETDKGVMIDSDAIAKKHGHPLISPPPFDWGGRAR